MNRRKTSADYQREYRKRLRAQGLVKKEVWIHPEHARLLSRLEKQLREPGHVKVDAPSDLTHQLEVTMSNTRAWTTHTLFDALKEVDLFTSGQASLELVEGAEASIHLTMHDFGDLPVFVTVAGEQIVVDCLLWPESDVRDHAAFNEEVLTTHKLFPLSTISLDTLPDGERYYTMFGALSAYSVLPNIVFEIDVLADNVIKATEAYERFLTVAA